MKRIKSILCLIAAALFVFSAVSCSPPTDTGPSATPGSDVANGENSPNANNEGESAGQETIDRFVVGVSGSLGDLEYGSNENTSACFAVYDAIFYWDPVAKEVASDVLESWVWEDDVTLVCTIKDGVVFSNGAVATAEDVLFSYMYHFDWGSPLFSTAGLITEECVTRDGKTVQFKFEKPNYAFMATKTFLYNKEWCESVGFDSEEWYHPVTSGRYECVEFIQGTGFTLRARDDYWNAAEVGTPHILEYQFKLYNDSSVMYMDLELGNMDLCNIDGNDFNRFLKDGGNGFNVIPKGNGSVIFFILGYADEPAFSDIRVREALAIGIDWEGIGTLVYGPLYARTDALVPVDSPEYIDVGTREFNPERAKELLAEAGYGPGDLKMYSIQFNTTQKMTLCEAIQGAATEIGIDFTVEFADIPTAIESWTNDANIDFTIMDSPQGAPMQNVYSIARNLTGTAIPFYYVTDDHFQELMVLANTTNDAARDAAVSELLQYIYDNAFTIPITEMRGAIAYSTSKLTEQLLDDYCESASAFHLGHLGMSSAWGK